MPHGSRWGKKAGVKNGRGGPHNREWTPTLKQLRYMKARMSIGTNGKQLTIREAAEVAGYSTTDAQLRRLATNPHMQKWMREIMAEADVTEAQVVEVFKQGMEAMKVTRTTYKGDVVETFEDVDWATRLASARTLAELMGLFQKKNAGEQDGPGSVTNILVLSDKMDGLTDEQLESAMARQLLGLPQEDDGGQAIVLTPMEGKQS